MLITRSILVLVMAVLATSIQAESINCTPITTLPVTITSQGIYCLTGNLSIAQNYSSAITINANNVTLDLNGWKLVGQGNGIQAFADNVTIKNGIVRGFSFGIYLFGRGEVVQNMLVDQSSDTGIWVMGLGAVVEHNRVVNTGGSSANSDVIGISVGGFGSTVSNNLVMGVTANGTGNEYGILATGTVRNNVISNTTLPTGGGTSFGIFAYQSIVLNNTVSNFVYGISMSNGGIYAYNTANNCTMNYSGGTAGAGNSGT